MDYAQALQRTYHQRLAHAHGSARVQQLPAAGPIQMLAAAFRPAASPTSPPTTPRPAARTDDDLHYLRPRQFGVPALDAYQTRQPPTIVLTLDVPATGQRTQRHLDIKTACQGSTVTQNFSVGVLLPAQLASPSSPTPLTAASQLSYPRRPPEPRPSSPIS